jgi:hypothetical protein
VAVARTFGAFADGKPAEWLKKNQSICGSAHDQVGCLQP